MAGGEVVKQVRASSPEAHQYVEVNQPGRYGYRVAAGLVGLVYAAFGVIALAVAGDVPFAGEQGHALLGLSLNRGTGVLLLAAALLVLAAAATPGNRGATTLTAGAVLLLAVGLFFLAVFRTGANIVAFSIVDVVAFWVLAMIVLWCGMHTFEADDEGHRTVLANDRTEYVRQPND